MTIQTINPATGEALHTYAEMNIATVNNIIDLTCNAFRQWHTTSFLNAVKNFVILLAC